MHKRKRSGRPILAAIMRHSWIQFFLKFTFTVLVLSYHCEAQCSTPPALFHASTEPQSIYSLNYPGTFPASASCSWRINSPISNGRIQIRVVQYSFSDSCSNDFLLMKDGANSTANSIAILCSQAELNPVTLTSSGPFLYGEFQSNDNDNTGQYTLEFNYFDSNASCPSGWIERQGFCYKLYNELLPWQQGALQCGYDGGFLTSIVDQEENDFIVASFQSESVSAWIGMDFIGNWLDGSSSIFYDNFDGESTSVTQCAFIDFSDNGRWHVTDCTTQRLNFICKKTQDGSGGRYWTVIPAPDGGEGGGTNTIGIVVGCLFAIGFIWFFCLSGTLKPSDWLLTKLLSSLRDSIRNCLCNARDAVRRRLPCLRSENSSRERRGSHNEVRSSTRAPQNTSTSQSSQSSPPSYGDVTSEPPPPSYDDALDTAFDVSQTDVRRSTISVNIDDSIPAPSYESVVGSDSNI